MAETGEEVPPVEQAPEQEAATAAEDAPAAEETAEEAAEDPKSPVKSPKKSKAKKEEPASEKKEEKDAEPKTVAKKGRAKKEDKETKDEEKSEDDANVGQYWEVQEGQKRQRKSLEHFKVEVAKTKELEVKTGAGKKLGDIKQVVNFVSMHTIKKADPKDPLKDLSRLLFNRHGGNPREIKANILEFNGFVFADEKAEENMKTRIHKKVMSELKGIMMCLALERTARAPPGLAKKAKASKKRTASGSKKKTPAKGASKKGKDDGEEDEEDEEEDEEGEEEEEEVKPAAKKAKTAPKSTEKAKASPKKAAAKDDEDSDMDAPLVTKVDPFLEKLKTHVQDVIKEQDMDLLTLRKVRDILQEKYSVDVDKYKNQIREFVDEIVSATNPS